MDKLEYDLQVSGIYREDDSLVVDIGQQRKALENKDQADAIEFSAKIVSLLQEKLKAHNQEYSKRVKLYQLKEAFCKGARMYAKNLQPKLVNWGLARVNLFLRISSGKIKDINLELDKNSSYNTLMDIANYFTPSEIDFEQAKLDVENHSLNSHFDDIDDLYVDERPEPPFSIGW
jgi:hypothetical protein